MDMNEKTLTKIDMIIENYEDATEDFNLWKCYGECKKVIENGISDKEYTSYINYITEKLKI